MARRRIKARFSFSRKPGAFDRYLASQIDSEGKKLLNIEPLKEFKPPADAVFRDPTSTRRTPYYR